jgi:tol-pal system protein YbgF
MREGKSGSDRTRSVVVKGLVLGLSVLVLGGCATKRDLRDLQTEVRNQRMQQDAEMVRRHGEVRDSLAVQNEALFQLRGQLMTQLISIQEQLVTIQQLTGQNQQNVAMLREQLEADRSRLMAPPEVSSNPEQIAPAAAGTTDATELYNEGVTQLGRGSRVTARRAFQAFLSQSPNHPLAADARYFLADILVQEDRWEEAIVAFNEVAELHPASPRVPEAFYRVGLAYIQLNRTQEARDYLNRVVTGYPDSGSAALAREALAQLPR